MYHVGILSHFSINLLAFCHKCCSLIGYTLHYLMCLSVLSIRAGSQPKQLATGQSLASYLRLTFLSIGIKKRSNENNCETSASNVWVEIKAHFRSYKRVYLISHERWKLIEGSWNACNIFTEQDPARNWLKIMKRSRKNNL